MSLQRHVRGLQPLHDLDHLIRRNIPLSIHMAAWPMYFKVGFAGSCKPEVYPEIALRQVAAAAAHFIHLPPAAFGRAVNASPNGGPV